MSKQRSSYDDMLNSLIQAALARVGMQQNNDMRKMAAWAGIAALPTAVAAIYGMNFHRFPELGFRYGYPMALLLMLASAVLPLWYLKRRGWI